MGLKLLCIVAHPDDECFAFGGALALAGRQGIETCVVCLTDGQAASNRGAAADGQDLGRMRREEFLDSCSVLGVTHAELLDYQDGQLEFEDFNTGAQRLVERMREFKPDIVLTFGPDGGLNTHPDHTMVSLLTTAAYHWSASAKRFPDAGQVHHAARLFYVTTDFFMDDRPAPMPAPWTVRLDVGNVREVKSEAFRRHASQAPLMEKTRTMFVEHGAFEFYTLAAAREPQAATVVDGLFDGLS